MECFGDSFPKNGVCTPARSVPRTILVRHGTSAVLVYFGMRYGGSVQRGVRAARHQLSRYGTSTACTLPSCVVYFTPYRTATTRIAVRTRRYGTKYRGSVRQGAKGTATRSRFFSILTCLKMSFILSFSFVRSFCTL